MKSYNSGNFVLSGDRDWETIDEGVKRKILSYNNELMMVHVCFEKGAIGKRHHHLHHQISFIESGSFEVEIDNHKRILRQGDSFVVEPDIIHGVVALERSSIIDVFNPIRTDFFD